MIKSRTPPANHKSKARKQKRQQNVLLHSDCGLIQDGQFEYRQPPNWCGLTGLLDPNLPQKPCNQKYTHLKMCKWSFLYKTTTMCDYRADRHTDGWTDRRRTKWQLCADMHRRRCTTRMAEFQGMNVLSAKQRVATKESVATKKMWLLDRQTSAGQSDRYAPLCTTSRQMPSDVKDHARLHLRYSHNPWVCKGTIGGKTERSHFIGFRQRLVQNSPIDISYTNWVTTESVVRYLLDWEFSSRQKTTCPCGRNQIR